MRFGICVVAVCLAMVGCSKPGDLSSVTGKVTLNGDPLADAYVEFYPQGESGNLAYGKTNSAGVYEARVSSSMGGATLGQNLVRISTKGEEASSVEKVPAKYNKNSELKVEVKEGANTFDFELEAAEKPAR